MFVCVCVCMCVCVNKKRYATVPESVPDILVYFADLCQGFICPVACESYNFLISNVDHLKSEDNFKTENPSTYDD